MGEFAKASMRRGVENADVVIAIVSPSYIKSVNCGFEIDLAYKSNKTVIPLVYNVPFAEWPPEQIGTTAMQDQFATDGGDVKIFIEMSEADAFYDKFENELIPRLTNLTALKASSVSETDKSFQDFDKIMASDCTPESTTDNKQMILPISRTVSAPTIRQRPSTRRNSAASFLKRPATKRDAVVNDFDCDEATISNAMLTLDSAGANRGEKEEIASHGPQSRPKKNAKVAARANVGTIAETSLDTPRVETVSANSSPPSPLSGVGNGNSETPPAVHPGLEGLTNETFL
jgi:hypothetical protein